MNTKRHVPTLLVAIAPLTATFSSASAAEPKYKADVPQSLVTPDKVQTEMLGELDFVDGMPIAATVKKTYDFIDLSATDQRCRLGTFDERSELKPWTYDVLEFPQAELKS